MRRTPDGATAAERSSWARRPLRWYSSELLIPRYSRYSSAARSVRDPVDQQHQCANEQRHAHDRHDDDVDRVEPSHVGTGLAVLANAQERPSHRLDGAQERGAAGPCRRVCAHDLAPTADCTAADGAAGVTLPTSKKVYDSVIVVTSLDSFGSMTNTTGHCFVSPGSSVCCLKQKHSSLLKWAAAWCGA